MARRTITFAEGIEDGIREKQIEMIRGQKRDVPFTEVVNWLILKGLWWDVERSAMSAEELPERVQQWIRGLDKIKVDAFLDSMPVTPQGDRPKV